MAREMDSLQRELEMQDLGVILSPTRHGFECQAVLNPACIRVDDTTHIFYRAVRSAFQRRNMISSIGYAQWHDNRIIERYDYPILVGECEYSKRGIEDPRIVSIDGIYYMIFSVYDGKVVLAAYATSTHLPFFTHRGLISPRIRLKEALEIFKDSYCGINYQAYQEQYMGYLMPTDYVWGKNFVLFPRKINGKFALLHRVLPGIQVIYFDSFDQLTTEFWKDYLFNIDKHHMMCPMFDFETHHIAPGCPPIDCGDCWLLIYHAVKVTEKGHNNQYNACAALAHYEEPHRIIRRLETPIFSPTHEWEKKGDVDNVVFPTGTAVYGDRLFIYYGAGDSVICCKTLSISKLLNRLKNGPNVIRNET